MGTPPIDQTTRSRPRILVVGCGGIGGLATALLAESNQSDVVGLSRNANIAAVANGPGFFVRDLHGERRVQARVVTGLDSNEAAFDYVLLATQPPQAEEAVREILPWLSDNGAVVVLQNGLMEDRIVPIAGPERVVGAVVGWGASMLEPGHVECTATGPFTLGRPDGRDDPRFPRLSLALEPVAPVIITNNLSGARWSKIAISNAITTLGCIGGDTLGSLMLHRTVRRLALEIMTETVMVAEATSIQLEKVSGTLELPSLALSPVDRTRRASPKLLLKHSVLLAVGARYRNLRSSMLRALERNREPSADFLNGEVTSRAMQLGLSAPVNQASIDYINDIFAGRRKPSMDTIRDLYAATADVRPSSDS